MVGEGRTVALEFLFHLMSEGIEFYIFDRLICQLVHWIRAQFFNGIFLLSNKRTVAVVFL